MNDPLSDLLRTVRLAGGVFLEAHFTAPWCVTACVRSLNFEPFAAEPAHVIAYHYVVSGHLLLGFESEEPVAVGAGEIIMFPKNDGHRLSSGLGLQPVPTDALIQQMPDGGLARIAHGGGGEATEVICGFLLLEDAYHPLLAALPRFLRFDVRNGPASALIDASTRFAARQLAEGRTASSAIMTRLSELLFVEAVRHHAAGQGSLESGWLRGLRDPQVGRAMALVHQNIARMWSAEDLAREVALSRSAFIERFTSLVGMPPIRYASMWRLETAKRHLRESSKNVAQVAHAVGYESEEAFSRAFKREFGQPPAQWRSRAALA